MKHDLKLLLAALTALGLPVALPSALQAAETLTQAQITQIIKDVKTIDSGKDARPAIMKETLQGDQAVRTGIDSRTELYFNDHTITRLGASTHFSFKEGTRNMSLQSGVMLLQVPKGVGGAKIETAAVTAAVTGTTIMVEAGKDYTKLIVLEGECCIWPKNDKNENKFFKFKHKTCVTEGQEVILRNGAKTIPDPVYVNLKILEGTSLLLTGNWNSPINPGPINAAAAGQGPNDFIPTNLAIIGAGTDVTVIQGQLPQNPPNNPPGTPPFTPPGKYGPLTTIPGGSFAFGGGSTINTDPKIFNGPTTSYGRIYRGPLLDGNATSYFFPGSGINPSAFSNSFTGSDGSNFPNYGVAAFKFSNLTMTGVPAFQMSGNGANDLALISEGFIHLTSSGEGTNYDFSSIFDLTLAAQNGAITIDSGVNIEGVGGLLQLFNNGAANNIAVNGDIEPYYANYEATTQGSYTQNGSIDVTNISVTSGGDYTQNGDIGDNYLASFVTVLSGGAITQNGNTGAFDIDLEAQGAFGGTGNLSAPFVTLASGGLMTLTETPQEGPPTDDVNGVALDMNALEQLTITGNGIYIPNGFTGEPPDSEGPVVDLTLTSNAGISSGTIDLEGDIFVDSLTATADSDITANANITANNGVSLTSNNGDVTVSGQSTASSFTISGNNVTLTSDATLDTTEGLDGNGPVTLTANNGTATVSGTITSGSIGISGDTVTLASTTSLDTTSEEGGGMTTLTSSGTVTTDGAMNTGSLVINGSDIIVNTTNVDENNSGLNASGSINLNASNSVTVNGFINTPSLTIGGLNSGPVPASFTLASTGEIDADNITIDAGIVDIEGAIYSSDYNDNNGAPSFTVDTTSSSVPLVNENDSMEDFFSVSGSGAIDAQTITVSSRGDLILDSVLLGGIDPDAQSPTLNNVVLDPYGDLTELDLTGNTIEVPDGYINNTVGQEGDQFNESTKLSLTSTGGDIQIGGDINVGMENDDSTGEFDATASGNIVVTNGPTFTADIMNLSAGQITTDEGGLNISAGNLSLAVSNADANLSQDPEIFNEFYFDETTTGTDQTPVGNININMDTNASSPSLSVSANDLTVSNLDFSSFNSFSLSLSSANDINGNNTSATITAATSVMLQVGESATLSGDGNSNIDYDNTALVESNDAHQLIIDTSVLGTFSVTANDITITGGFPDISSTDLSLIATGSNGINVDVDLNVGSANFTANQGGITTNAITTNGGDITLTGNEAVTVMGALSTGGTSAGTTTIYGASVHTEDTVTSNSISLTAYNGDLTTDDVLTAGGGITLSSTNGSIFANSMLSSGGDLTMTQSGSGNININGDLSIGGGFTATADGSIIVGEIDPTIGAGMSLTAGNAIEINEDITIGGDLTLSAGTFIHTADDSVITGATSVTLVLGTAAEISESGSTHILSFGVPAASEQDGYGPIGIDLTAVASGFSSVSGTAASLTLTSNFKEPNITLSLASTSGDLVLNGAVTAFDFYAYSTGGDITVNDGVTTSDQFIATSSGNVTLNGVISAPTDVSPTANGGNVVVNGSVFTSIFDGVASGIISGTGSIFSTDAVEFSQGGAATINQTDASHLVYDSTLTVMLSSTYGNVGELDFSASPVTLASAITLPNVNLSFSGGINTQGNSISGFSVTLDNLQTTTDASGNSTNITATGNSFVTLEELSLNGANGTAGSGGILTITGSGGEGSRVNIFSSVTATGGSSGGNGGTVNITSQNNINTSEGGSSVDASGGSGGGNGGTINLTAQNGSIGNLGLTALGGDASPSSSKVGGNGGTISLTTGGALDIEDNISADGGAGGNGGGGAAGGNGGTVNLTSTGTLTVGAQISAQSGINGGTKRTGGNGGTVNLTSQDTINVNSTIKVSASDLVRNRLSAKGGNINITSQAATGVAINISDSGQLSALLNQAAVGPGGTITFMAAKGGSIGVSGQVRADNGTIAIQTGTADGTGPGGAVTLAGANLSADVVKVGSLGANGTLTIGNTVINGDSAIQLYAAGDNGSVVFNGDTSLTGASIKSIAGSTVTINKYISVNVTGGAATVYTNQANYFGSGGTGLNNQYGSFTGNTNTTTKPFASRPAF